MRRLLSLVFAAVAGFILVPNAHSQAPRAKRYVPSKCDILCDNLTIAIQQQPDNLVMRLEDALVINERCAAEIVTAAITAVNAEPRLVDQIVKTALHVAPNRSRSILYSVNHFTPRAPAAVLAEEIRRPEIPQEVAVGPAVEIRRAERADAPVPTPVEEVRKAELPATAAAVSALVEEIRKAEPASPTGQAIGRKNSRAGKSPGKDS